jgi:hypothetical protein
MGEPGLPAASHENADPPRKLRGILEFCRLLAACTGPQRAVKGSATGGERTFSAVAKLTRWLGTNYPLPCVMSLNGGWTADPERNKPGRDLGYTRYDKMAEALGCYAEYMEEPEAIRHPPGPATRLEGDRGGMVGFVNVKTDYRARAPTVRFSGHET